MVSKTSVQLLSKVDEAEYVLAETISLKNHPHYNEAWLHERIKQNPNLLELGELVLRDHERRQQRAGRLDLLMEDIQRTSRYEIEIQLGATDESHIIRTIEYWDIERKRYPQYEHCAVIIAEDITTRFLNVISLFNGHIPIVAIQVKAVKIENRVSLVFTKVLSEIQLGTIEDDSPAPETNRTYWEERANPEIVQMADILLEYIKTFVGGFQLKYNKMYIGLFQNNKAQNFVVLKPQKTNLRLELGCKISNEFKTELENEGITVGDYTPHRRVPIYLSKEDLTSKKEIITKAMKYAYDNWNS